MRKALGAWLWRLAVRIDPSLSATVVVQVERTVLDAIYAEGWSACVTAIDAVRDSLPDADLDATLDVVRSAPIRAQRNTWFTPGSSEVH